MFDQMTLPGIGNAISLPGWVAGPSPPVSPDGQKTGKSGQPLAPASRSRSRVKAPELLTRGTYGPTFSASPVPDGPLSSWENRLRQRLAKIGSSECDLTWKASAMSDGVLLSRLVPSTPRTVEIDSGLLLEAAYSLAAQADYWRTPQAAVIDARSNVVKFSGRSPGDPQVGLPDQVVATMGLWPTPLVGSTNPAAHGQISGQWRDAMAKAMPSAMWPTPTAVDGARGLTTRPQDTGIPLPQRVGQVLGIPPAGSSATTAKRGVLNPAFPCWLMGYPPEHLSCGATAMQSFQRWPQKS